MFFAQGMYDELQNFSHFPGPVEKNHWLLLIIIFREKRGQHIYLF